MGISKIEDTGQWIEITFTNGQRIVVSYVTDGTLDLIRIVEILATEIK